MLGMRAFTVVCSIGLLATVACGKSETNPITTTGAGASGGAISAGGTGGSGGGGGLGGAGGSFTGCHPQEHEAPAIEIMQINQDLPVATGNPNVGGIRNGVYWLVAMNRYTGPSGNSGPTGSMWRETARYDGPEVWSIIDMFDGTAPDDQKRILAYQPDDMGVISFSITCPEPQSSPYDRYTFIDGAPAVLKLYATTAKVEWVYELQDNGSGAD